MGLHLYRVITVIPGFYHMQIFAFQKRVRARDMAPEALYGCETHRKACHRAGQTISETYPKHSANGYLRKKLQQFCSGRFCLPLTVSYNTILQYQWSRLSNLLFVEPCVSLRVLVRAIFAVAILCYPRYLRLYVSILCHFLGYVHMRWEKYDSG